MNFLTEPTKQFKKNSPMNEEEEKVATDFVEELIELGVLRKLQKGRQIHCLCPLFCVAKAGQPGEHRVIADMKSGGQNLHIGRDPVFLFQHDSILSQLYAGGYTAVADASKFFYQFPTRPQERKYLGVLHPIAGAVYEYWGLPMGSGSSPGIAGRMGASFFRLLVDRHPELFDGVTEFNTWYDGLKDEKSYEATLGHGLVIRSNDGLPAVKVFIHIDDFCLHGPTYEKTVAALNALMDRALDVGMLFNPAKVVPPQQEVKYCGLIYDTQSLPTLRIPTDKRDRALAMIDFVLARRGSPLSKLALSVLVGTLQSLVDATPSRLGQTFLRQAYDLIHTSTEDGDDSLDPRPSNVYYSCTDLSMGAWDDLSWWRNALSQGVSRRVRFPRAGTLVATWGDGSGTGTGGTIQTFSAATPARPLMWMGQWAPIFQVGTSNAKEMRTLLATLEIIWADPTQRESAEGSTLFYFTDSTCVYFAVTSGASKYDHLQILVRKIKELELRLGCLLEVVHVPGKVMIEEGTDGLSRGVWVSPLHNAVGPAGITAQVFGSVPESDALLPWVYSKVPILQARRLRMCRLGPFPSANALLHRYTVWAPLPEVARQLISALLFLRMESPATTGFCVVVPRILLRQWGNLSRSAILYGPFDWSELPVPCQPALRVPLMIVHIPPHQRCLPYISDSVDPSPLPADARWHREQAELLRGLR
jgi:hypothetical protein